MFMRMKLKAAHAMKATRLLLPVALAGFLIGPARASVDDEECLDCHGERDFVVEREGKEVSLYVNGEAFARSVHADIGCVGCHEDADVEELPHEEGLSPVDCSGCHDEIASKFERSLHGRALREDKYLAPGCPTCHTKHNILAHDNPAAKTYVMNVPSLCGSCHKEGAPVSQLRSVSEHHVLENYSQSIHGEGLFKRGLIVTAVCSSCHTSHDILPHEDPASSINRNNIAKTCMQCHAQIEQVHLKVIRGELWEKKPHQIPICVDCHQPHNVRRVFYEESFPDTLCMSCHARRNLQKQTDGQSVPLYVDEGALRRSIHGGFACIKCHANVSPSRRPACRDSGNVDCSMCHSAQVEDYERSRHGRDHAAGNPIAPYCTDCHGTHTMQSREEVTSPTFARNIPDLCGRCHREGQKAAVVYRGPEHEIIRRYKMSIHGKGLLESGLMVTATCVDCHTAHRELPASDPASTVHGDNIASTCAKCHLGIYEVFKQSVHSPLVTKTSQSLPTCKDCHLSHTIERVDLDDFRQGILDQCGKCHMGVAATYFETFHGKVSKLGSAKTAKCFDCHGSHNILPVSNPRSTLSPVNVVATCKKCHPNSNRMFVGYLTHATHHNRNKYPYLFYTFWLMTLLLLGTFSIFGAHTLLWLPKAVKERRNGAKAAETAAPPTTEKRQVYFERFDAFSRFLHLLVIISFLSLAVTGMTIKFSGVGVFQRISRFLGGYEVTGYIHRAAAIITFAYFFLHIGYLIQKKRKSRRSFREMISGETSLIFRKKDLVELVQTVKWFLGLGPRPAYGMWTYWEKFDYFAVFWGVTVIGASGLLLWFPEFFTNRFGLPGWLVNVATIIHSDEALLATGFIFTVHFFNTHFRPDKFPMDPVIFTGRVSLEELKQDRPRAYEAALKTRAIKKRLAGPPPRWLQLGARIFGLSCLCLGIVIILAIIYSMVFLYR